jgi:hypothetical protein
VISADVDRVADKVEATGATAQAKRNAYVTGTVLQNAKNATDAGTVKLDTTGFNTVSVTIAGITSATVTFVGTNAAGTAVALNAKPIGGSQLVQSATADGSWIVDVASVTQFYAPITVYASGTITVTAYANSSPNHADIQNVNLATYIKGEDSTNDLIATANKPVASGTYSGTAFAAFLSDVDIAVKATAGNILSVTCSSMNEAVRYLQVHNKATAPAGGDVPIFSFSIPAGTSTQPAIKEVGREFFGDGGYYCATGIAVGVSTTAATFTASTTTDHVINGTYI